MISSSLPAPVSARPLVAAVRELLAHYADLRGYLAVRLRNPDDAADIAQSSFAQVYAYSLNRPVANSRALLFQAARNLCIDQHRRRGVELAALDDWLARVEVFSPSIEEVMIARQQLAHLIALIEGMPRLRREVFVRVRLHGQPHRQVSIELGLSAKAVELHIARAVYDLSELSLARQHD